jgi:hypothetical protein
MMMKPAEERLEAWRKLREGGPAWLLEGAPRIIAQIEAEIAARTPKHSQEQSNAG